MFYDEVAPDIVGGLEVLQERIERARVPLSIIGETLNIATWNIRGLNKLPQQRSQAATYFIAEILSQLDADRYFCPQVRWYLLVLIINNH